MSFVLACIDKGYKLSKIGRERVQVHLFVNKTFIKVQIRKYTRDLCVFEQIFIQQDYLPCIHALGELDSDSPVAIIYAGANIGCASLFFLAFYPQANLLLIEPEKSNFELCNENIFLTCYSSQVKVVRNALWNKHEWLSLQQRDTSHDGFYVMTKPQPDMIIDKVQICTINDIFSWVDKKRFDLLKIDIEGAEKILFESERDLSLMLRNTFVLALEVHEEFISESTVRKILENNDFTVDKNGEYLIASRR